MTAPIAPTVRRAPRYATIAHCALGLALLACGLPRQARATVGYNGAEWRTDNSGHPQCNGGDSNWPYLLCWGGHTGEKHYNCMWYTMEVLSGWPGNPRRPSLECDDLEIDCESSFVCTVLLQYKGVGPMPSFGEDADREIAAECLIRHCPKQAAVAERVLEGQPDARCPHTHFVQKVSSTMPMPMTVTLTLTEEPGGEPVSEPVVANTTGTENVSAPPAVVDPCMPMVESANRSADGSAPMPAELRTDTAQHQSPLTLLGVAVVLGLLAVLGLMVFRPKEQQSAREVLLPPAVLEPETVVELEAQETIAIAVNDAE